jgi:hypothetical protein
VSRRARSGFGGPLVSLAVIAAVAAAAGCAWNEFDDIERDAPVRALGRPADLASVDYPAFVVPLGDPRGNAELLAIGANNLGLVDFTFRPDGTAAVETVASDRFLLGGEQLEALDLVAALPAGLAPRLAAVSDRQPLVVSLASSEQDFAVSALGDPLPATVTALAVGDALATGTSDVVIVSGATLYVLGDSGAGTAYSCDLGTSASTVAVGAGFVAVSQSDPGAAYVVRPPYANDLTGRCQDRTELAGASAATGFGTALVVADLDGDGTEEVAVSAPREKLVYRYTLADLAAPLQTITAVEATPDAYGAALAFGVIEGRRTLLVGDPGTAADAPGAVWLHDLAAPETPTRLERPNDDVKRFGARVGVLPFVGTAGRVDLLYATATAVASNDPGVVYLYYWVSDPATDPRSD